MASPPNMDDVLAGAAEALASPHEEIRHGDKKAVYRSPEDVQKAIGVAKAMKNGPQFRVVVRPKKTKL